jgi:hypothetical protein
MPRSSSKRSGKRRKIGVGQKVTFRMGPQLMTARVVEDRGNIGKGGRQLLRIRVNATVAPEADPEWRDFEIAAEDVTVKP